MRGINYENPNKFLRDYLPKVTQYLESQLYESICERIDEIKQELTQYIKQEGE